MNRLDELFGQFIKYMVLVLLLFGAGMILVVLFGNEALALRMVNVFAAMFTGVTGLGSGYLLGARAANGKNGNGKDDHK